VKGRHLSWEALPASQVLEPDAFAVRRIDEGDVEFSEATKAAQAGGKAPRVSLGLLEHIHGSDLNLLALHAGNGFSLMEQNIVGSEDLFLCHAQSFIFSQNDMIKQPHP